MSAKSVLENMTDQDRKIIALEATVAQQAKMIEHLRGGLGNEPQLVSYAEDMSTCTLTTGDGTGYFYDRVDPDQPAQYTAVDGESRGRTMTDYSELKMIAEACIRNGNGLVFDKHQNRPCPEFMPENKGYVDLVLASIPDAVLSLISENDGLKEKYEAARDRKNSITLLKMQNDQLKAENETLMSKEG